MADFVAIVSLDSKTGEHVDVKTVVTPQEVGLVLQVGEGAPTVVRIDQPGNQQATRRLSDALLEAYHSARRDGSRR